MMKWIQISLLASFMATSAMATETLGSISASLARKQRAISEVTEMIRAHERMSVLEIQDDLIQRARDAGKQLNEQEGDLINREKFDLLLQRAEIRLRQVNDKGSLLAFEKAQLQMLQTSTNCLYAFSLHLTDEWTKDFKGGKEPIYLAALPVLGLVYVWETAVFGIFELIGSIATGF